MYYYQQVGSGKAQAAALNSKSVIEMDHSSVRSIGGPWHSYQALRRPLQFVGYDKHTVYSPEFYINFSDDDRAYLCHLLSLITRKKHVRPFRIQMLCVFLPRALKSMANQSTLRLELWKTCGNEPALLRLIYVYEKHRPDVLPAQYLTGTVPHFEARRVS